METRRLLRTIKRRRASSLLLDSASVGQIAGSFTGSSPSHGRDHSSKTLLKTNPMMICVVYALRSQRPTACLVSGCPRTYSYDGLYCMSTGGCSHIFCIGVRFALLPGLYRYNVDGNFVVYPRMARTHRKDRRRRKLWSNKEMPVMSGSFSVRHSIEPLLFAGSPSEDGRHRTVQEKYVSCTLQVSKLLFLRYNAHIW